MILLYIGLLVTFIIIFIFVGHALQCVDPNSLYLIRVLNILSEIPVLKYFLFAPLFILFPFFGIFDIIIVILIALVKTTFEK